jgi:hypothetical protein
MKSCCIDSAERYLKRNCDVATCDRCGFLLMAYTRQLGYEEALKNLKAWGGEFSTAKVGDFQVVAKVRSSRKPV